MIKTSGSAALPDKPGPEQTQHALLGMLVARGCESEAHAAHLATLSLQLAEKAGLPAEAREGMRCGALLHDIGKIAIPDAILFKPGKLTDAEWGIMQKHPQYGCDLLAPMPSLQHALAIPYCHHEHWDGSGYPRGLAGSDIPLEARIFTIVDIFDALSSDRPFRPAWKEDAVRFYLVQQAGISLDPALVPLFLALPGIFPNHK